MDVQLDKSTRKMNIFCKKIFVILCFVFASTSATQECNGNAQCIVFEECRGLYVPLTVHYAGNIRKLVKLLHCGFNENEEPLICCSPALQKDPNSNAASALLPDLNTCGVMNNNAMSSFMTDIDEHPWIALIKYKKPVGSAFYCGGVLISSRYVLTAAHCVIGADLPETWTVSEVRLGEWNTSSAIDCIYEQDCSPPPLDVPVEEIVAHKDYSPSDEQQHNDIALLRLSYDVPFTDFVKPICLPIYPELRRESFEGVNVEVAGWGKQETRTGSEIKLRHVVPVVNSSICQNVYRMAGRVISDKQLCAGGQSDLPGQVSCTADSGGPLMTTNGRNWMAVGVASYGPSPCSTPGWPGVYTRVTAYLDWIISNMRS